MLQVRRTVTADRVKSRFFREAFGRPLLDNTMRGLWCEFMVAEALGPECRTVGFGWHPWDLQIGPDTARFPERMRIQLKNAAVLQSWNAESGKLTNVSFNLTWRQRPAYFTQTFPHVPCEEVGFLCDLFVLCHHPIRETAVADHRDPGQWHFYLLPVTGPTCAVSESELRALRSRTDLTGKPATTQRQPATMQAGIRGRPPIAPIGIDELSVEMIRGCFIEP